MADSENEDLDNTVREHPITAQQEDTASVPAQLAALMQEIKNLKIALNQQQRDARASTETNSEGEGRVDNMLAEAVSELSRTLTQTPAQPVIKLYDLPEFSGRPEDWPMFREAFTATTQEYRYTERQNMIRLQKALKGHARETVQCLLIHSGNVNRVLETLKERFGRPELLVKSQISHIRDVANIPEFRLDLIIPFATKVQNLASFLSAADCDHHLSNPSLMEELVSKLPVQRRLTWARHSLTIQPRPTIQHLSDWLQEEARVVSMICTNVGESRRQTDQRAERRPRFFHAVEAQGMHIDQCIMCSGGHDLERCSRFVSLRHRQRWQFIREKRLCFNCLRFGHRSISCARTHECSVSGCDKKWHELLHEPRHRHAENNQDSHQRPRILTNIELSPGKERLLFKILPVKLYANGKSVDCYALLDEGSSLSLMNEKLAAQLGIAGPKEELTLQWFGSNMATESSMAVNMEISGVGKQQKRFPLRNVKTVKNLQLPSQTLSISQLHVSQRHLRKLPLMGYSDATPDLLIGLDNVHLGIAKRIADDGRRGPAAVLTKLGWVIYGSSGSRSDINKQVFLVRECNGMEDQTVEELVRKFVVSDDLGVSAAVEHIEPAEEAKARAVLEKTTVRLGDRFETGLLWKNDEDILEDSRRMAERRLFGLERKLASNQELRGAYINIMRSYEAKGYSRKLTAGETLVEHPRKWYLPHFGVLNPNKPGKVRLVFDAAAQVSGRSLNSYLLSGPDLGKPLLEVLMKFRQKPIAVSADIEEMFLQVAVRAEDQPAQRLLWRENPAHKIQEYAMRVMTFGATCSPCAAQYVKNKNAMEFVKEFPEAVDAILNYHYVDDFVHCFDDVDEAVSTAKQVKQIHSKGGFKLERFVSNSQAVCDALNNGNCSRTLKDFDNPDGGSQKVLGMQWDTKGDELRFVLAFGRVDMGLLQGRRVPTKRELLRVLMSVFDPFGVAAEHVLKAKLLLQMVWRAGTGWDEEIAEESQNVWRSWLGTLSYIEGIRVPRCYSASLTTGVVELHAFADASEEAFAAVAYWRIKSDNGVDVAFVSGKTKCAPLKLITIPRLELQAAVLASRLKTMVLNYHDVEPSRVVMWTDSKTVHAWITSDHRRYKPFVGHRVNEILDGTNPNDWRWIPGAVNPADFGTRLRSNARKSSWIGGPEFLKEDESLWPETNTIERTSEELRCKYQLFFTRVSDDILLKYSRFSRLIRVVAYARRFVKNCKRAQGARKSGSLTVQELREAELVVIRSTQRSAYPEEYALLQSGESVSASSRIFKLNPMLDDSGVIKVNGRLRNADAVLPHTRQPTVMPQGHHVTNILTDLYHRIWKHQNENTIVSELRRKYWIPHIREEVRKATKRCLTCRRERAKPEVPQMGQLPADRLTPFVRPFTYVGLDYMGPFIIVSGRRSEKRWIALFTCLTTRAVHLEIAVDLTTDTCLLCIRNFMCRRGTPVRIRSDNGTNFLGADRELKRQLKDFEEGKIVEALANQGCRGFGSDLRRARASVPMANRSHCQRPTRERWTSPRGGSKDGWRNLPKTCLYPGEAGRW